MFSQFQHASVDFAANSPKQVIIPAGGMVDELLCELVFTPTVTAANNVAANIGRGDELALIGNIRLQGEGALPIFDLPGSTIKWLSYLCDYGVPLKIPTGLGDGATANAPVATAFILPMWSTRAGKPFDSALDNTGEPNGLTLTVNWADGPSFNSTMAAGAGGFVTPPTLKAYTLESKANEHPFLRKRRYWAQQTFNATGAQRLDLGAGNAYRRMLINTRAASGNDQSDMFSDARLYIGGQLRQVTSENLLDQAMRIRAGIRFGEVVTKNTKELSDANYLWELAQDGYLSHAADTSRRQGNYVEFNVTVAPCTVTVVYEVLDDLRRPEFQTKPVRE